LTKFNIHDKNSQQTRNRGELPQLDKEPTANVIPNDDKLHAFLVRSVTRQEYLFDHSYSTSYWKFWADTISQGKKIKGMNIGKKEIKQSAHT